MHCVRIVTLALAVGLFAPVPLIAVAKGSDQADQELAQAKASAELGDFASAIATWKKYGAYGNPKALYNLGWVHANGKGVAVNHVAANSYYKKAAALQWLPAVSALAAQYAVGVPGIPQDHAKAAEYFERASNLGDANATFNLGVLYLKGRGVVADEERAYDLISTAAAKGDSFALKAMEAIEADQKGRAASQARAVSGKFYFGKSQEDGLYFALDVDPKQRSSVPNLAAGSHLQASNPEALAEMLGLPMPESDTGRPGTCSAYEGTATVRASGFDTVQEEDEMGESYESVRARIVAVDNKSVTSRQCE